MSVWASYLNSALLTKLSGGQLTYNLNWLVTSLIRDMMMMVPIREMSKRKMAKSQEIA